MTDNLSESGLTDNLYLKDGTVIAHAGRDETGWRAFGPGSESDDYGSLSVGDILMVSSERMAVAAERHDMCWYRTQARVEPCNHKDDSYIVNGTGPDDTHTQQCQYCTTTFQAEKHLVVDEKCAICGTVIEYPAGIEEVQGSGFKIQDSSDGAWYDLSGRKYSKRPTKPGVYIHTGKKEVIQ